MFDTLLVLHFIGLALGVGTSFSMMALGIATGDMPQGERTSFMLRAMALSRNGSIGLLLLILSGLGMLLVKGPAAMLALGGGTFHAKLGLVVVLIGLFGYMQVLTKRARQAGGGPAMAKLPQVGRIMLLVGLAIVVLAVLSFH
jgi:uncharacterized membrane protein